MSAAAAIVAQASGQQDRTMRILEEIQMDDMLQLYNTLASKCFTQCANDFRTPNLTGKETKCVDTCVEKFLKHTQRITTKFAEQTFAQQEQFSQAQQPQPPQQ
eukprot:GFYU01009883.1.p1 GENE.GFYU01009883.1~~GFYU01009883.1.p1  ORF type:complete len:103 (-),score=42.13 GFYU01009883.1:193-501(-)